MALECFRTLGTAAMHIRHDDEHDSDITHDNTWRRLLHLPKPQLQALDHFLLQPSICFFEPDSVPLGTPCFLGRGYFICFHY